MITTEKKTKHSLLGLLIAQFFGAFNDNAWKVMVFTLATRPMVQQMSDGTLPSLETSSQLIATLSLIIFLIPMMLFSLPAGALADQFSKRTIIVLTKILEVVLMGGCALVLYLAPDQLILPFILLGLMGMQSALFGPAKYGIMPEMMPKPDLLKGNGLLEMWTMIAIIAGTGLGPLLLAADMGGQNPSFTWLGPLWLTILSCFGLAGAFFIRKVPKARANKQTISKSIMGAWNVIRTDKVLGLAILGSAIYWSMTSLIGQNILVYAKTLVINFEKGELLQGIPPASYGVGIALGALLSGKFSGDRIEYGFIPLGSIGFAIASLMLGTIQPEMIGTVALLLLMGMSSGLLIVPLHAIVQWRSPDEERGSIIALGNFLDIGGMTIGSLVAGGMALIGFGLKSMLIFSAFLIVLATIWCVRILPKALVRLCFILLTRTLYKFKVRGIDHLPKDGPVLLVANHVSAIDALFIMASVNRPVRFIMNESYYNKWYIYPIAKLMEAIPVSNTASTRLLIEGMRRAGEALDKGEVVCIFPEGQITRTGKILPFRRGIELIAKGRDCPIVPVQLENIYGHLIPFEKVKFINKLFDYFSYSLTISYGKPLRSNIMASELRKAIQEMEYAAWMARKEEHPPIHHHFIYNARKHPLQLMVADKEKKLKGWKLLTGSIALARILRQFYLQQPNIAVLLPTTIASVMTNIAIAISGRTVINLNFTTGNEALQDSIKQTQLKTLITSYSFIEKAKCQIPPGITVLFIEDLIKLMTPWRMFKALLMGYLSSISLIEAYCGCQRVISVDDPLTIIFTSGSTGNPKGVVLSHFNLSSNAESVSQVIPHMGKKPNLLASLPLFHSFGYMLMWLGLNHKLGLITHPNPLDNLAIGELVKKYHVKFMMTTPTFLRGYIKQVLPDQFGSLECVIAGAEKLPVNIADAFESKFGIKVIEGYGATECSPVIATSTMDVRQAGIYQIGTVKGTVGQTIPGVIAKVIDPETYQELPFNSEGLLLVKGPNIMQGYLGRADLTQQVMHEGWYITGDIAVIDENGFIKITDRIKRISKIGGEMIPHGRVEEALHEAAEEEAHVFTVTSVPDEAKGEKLVVLHTLEINQIGEILKKLIEKGLPNLYLPRADHFIKVETLPILGSGKIDLQLSKKIALEYMKPNSTIDIQINKTTNR